MAGLACARRAVVTRGTNPGCTFAFQVAEDGGYAQSLVSVFSCTLSAEWRSELELDSSRCATATAGPSVSVGAHQEGRHARSNSSRSTSSSSQGHGMARPCPGLHPGRSSCPSFPDASGVHEDLRRQHLQTRSITGAGRSLQTHTGGLQGDCLQGVPVIDRHSCPFPLSHLEPQRPSTTSSVVSRGHPSLSTLHSSLVMWKHKYLGFGGRSGAVSHSKTTAVDAGCLAAWRTARGFATGVESQGDANVNIFDKSLKALHRDRAAKLMRVDDPLLVAAAENLVDRLEDCRRSFPRVLVLGGAGEHVLRLLKGQGGVEHVTLVDSSQGMLARCQAAIDQLPSPPAFTTEFVVADEDLPFEKESFDAVISCLGLHWINELPVVMTQCRKLLKPDGLFLGSMLGGDTLRELRISCAVAELEREGGVSARVSPLARVRDAGNLLTRAGLALPTVDMDTLTIYYPSALELVEHLRSMGESNAVLTRRMTLKRDTALAAAASYQSMFAEPDGAVPATFEVIYLTGWAPHLSQQRARDRGSATVSLHDLQSVLAPAEAGPSSQAPPTPQKVGEARLDDGKRASDSTVASSDTGGGRVGDGGSAEGGSGGDNGEAPEGRGKGVGGAEGKGRGPEAPAEELREAGKKGGPTSGVLPSGTTWTLE